MSLTLDRLSSGETTVGLGTPGGSSDSGFEAAS